MTGYLDGTGPRAFAHRGWHTGDLAGLENSLAAFRRAVDEGYRYVETDVHTTKDGRLIAFHDYRLDRVTDGKGLIGDQTWDAIRTARIGGREPIPLFADVLEALPDTRFNIDPKSHSAVGPLLDLLRTTGATDRVCVGAFSDRRLAAIRRAGGPRLATSLGPRQVFRLVTSTQVRRFTAPRGWRVPKRRVGVVAAQVPVRFGRMPVISPGFVATAHAAGLEVHAWTIDNPAEMNRLLGLGVDGIMTDRPDVLRDVLQRRGAWT